LPRPTRRLTPDDKLDPMLIGLAALITHENIASRAW
jgi:hypothetical protein